jgi:hypothetical protein
VGALMQVATGSSIVTAIPGTADSTLLQLKIRRSVISCYISPTLKCYVIVYVDDFKIAGPEKNVKKAWGFIRAENTRTGQPGIVLDDPTPAGEFLGCNHVCSEIWAPPMSKDRTPMAKLPTGKEYDNYHAGAPPAAQTTARRDDVRRRLPRRA